MATRVERGGGPHRPEEIRKIASDQLLIPGKHRVFVDKCLIVVSKVIAQNAELAQRIYGTLSPGFDIFRPMTPGSSDIILDTSSSADPQAAMNRVERFLDFAYGLDQNAVASTVSGKLVRDRDMPSIDIAALNDFLLEQLAKGVFLPPQAAPSFY